MDEKEIMSQCGAHTKRKTIKKKWTEKGFKDVKHT